MRTGLVAIIGLVLCAVLGIATSIPASANAGCVVRRRTCTVTTTIPPAPGQGTETTKTTPPRTERGRTYPPMSAQRAAELQAEWAHDQLIHQRCLSTASLDLIDPSTCGAAPGRPRTPISGPDPAPVMTPAQAGAIAVAQLKLPADPPGIGPSPSLNRWKMAAVGYPLWLWLDGPSRVGPVSDSVGGLSVSLDARVAEVSFQMGDGHVVRCSDFDRRWTGAVKAGAASPSCGYTYPRPSLPKGDYRVTAVATWAVTWHVNGQSGVIDVPVAASANSPVGELQVLVR